MPITIEERVTKLERELAQLMEKVASNSSDLGWLTDFEGAFESDPAFDEAMRLGRLWRNAENERNQD